MFTFALCQYNPKAGDYPRQIADVSKDSGGMSPSAYRVWCTEPDINAYRGSNRHNALSKECLIAFATD